MTPNQNRQYRPGPTGDVAQDTAWRRVYDDVYATRNSFGPAALFARGTQASVTVAALTDNGFGLLLKLDRPGMWIVQCAVSLELANDPSQLFTVSLHVQGTRQPYFATINSATDGIYTLVQNWNIFSTTGAELCVLYIQKDGGGGTSAVLAKNSTMTAYWQGTERV